MLWCMPASTGRKRSPPGGGAHACPAGGGGHLENLLEQLCTDVHLAALAIANGWRLVSFDRDFERIAGLQRLPLP